jgi:hypothetical protein
MGADCVQERNCLLEELRRFHDRVTHFLHLRGECGDIEQNYCLGRLLHLVDRVIHGGDQVTDAAAVERRNESAVHGDEHLARRIVGVVLAIHYRFAVGRDGFTAFHHCAQGLCAGKHGL